MGGFIEPNIANNVLSRALLRRLNLFLLYVKIPPQYQEPSGSANGDDKSHN
ncbi:hypothetical protein Nit79A3_0525 [Nitrosomonas sp. Is79A3]